jgi:hypothetical protein
MQSCEPFVSLCSCPVLRVFFVFCYSDSAGDLLASALVIRSWPVSWNLTDQTPHEFYSTSGIQHPIGANPNQVVICTRAWHELYTCSLRSRTKIHNVHAPSTARLLGCYIQRCSPEEAASEVITDFASLCFV